MAEYESKSIMTLISEIQKDKIVLPAIQRNFVWPEDKVIHLFDSLMRDYPIGTFLFWEIDQTTFQQHVFNKFIQCYNEKLGKNQRGERVTTERTEYIAVLDGQQRITSLYIGINGSQKMHIKGRSWTADDSFEDRFLCLNILHMPANDDDSYDFSFQVATNIEKVIELEDSEGNKETKYWVKVGSVCQDGFDHVDYTDAWQVSHNFDNEQRINARKMLGTLRTAIATKKNVSYYLTSNMDISSVVEIFVRVNSGGQKLSASDLMLSVATGEQSDSDIHMKIKEAIDLISAATNDNGFKPDNEVILTAGLMFTGAASLSLKKKENYSREQITLILNNWDNIITAIKNAAQYLEHLGFNGDKLTSKNALLPIAYYFYKNDLDDKHKDRSNLRARRDRVFIRQWLLRSMITGVFSDAIGGTLLRIRALIDRSKKKYFPLDDLMDEKIKRSLNVEDEQIENMLNWKYGDVRIIPLLMDLAEDCSGAKYQADHIWPKSVLLSKKATRSVFPTITDEQYEQYKHYCHCLPNMQLLTALHNQEKSDRLFDEWVSTIHPCDTDFYYTSHMIPNDKTYTFDLFLEFIEKRKALLVERIRVAFPKDFSAIVQRYKLEE
ncbi:MAG: DUF262 domain-containing protein [Clostridia bacterium]|nr:DUF262 domain-containing protein [Clostridia bacterium]